MPRSHLNVCVLCAARQQECDQSVASAMDAKLKEKKAMALVSGLQADVEGLQTQVRRSVLYRS